MTRSAEQTALLLLLQRAKEKAADLVALYRQNRDADRFIAFLRSELPGWHAEAVYRGRRQAGDLAPMEADDWQYGREAADEDEPFLANFQRDLRAGRYTKEDGSVSGALDTRAALYAAGVLASANEAFALASAPEVRFWWRLGDDHPCSGCPPLAAGGPYSADDLPTVPGAGDTPCLGNCKCYLETEAGLTSFPFTDDDPAPEPDASETIGED